MNTRTPVGIAALLAVAVGAFLYSRRGSAAYAPDSGGIYSGYDPAEDYTAATPFMPFVPFYTPPAEVAVQNEYGDVVLTPATELLSTDYIQRDAVMPQLWKRNDYYKYAAAISEAERRYEIPTDLLARLLFQESSFLPDIIAGDRRSSVGAIGIGQFMPLTAERFGINPRDPFASIDAAGKYLRILYRMFGNWYDALRAYNWGEGNVAKFNRGETTTLRPTAIASSADYANKILADVPA